MSYKTETIKNIVIGISNNKYLLPAIQREWVWNYEKIENLFDSVLSGYPFGSMLFWEYKKEQSDRDYKFYEFIKIYDEYDRKSNHNKEHEIGGKDEVTAVLDGQQRLTALFLGLKGSLNLHKPKKKWDKAGNFDKKELYINLLYNKKHDEEDDDIKPEYELKFKTSEQVDKENKDQSAFWFKVGCVLDWKEKKDWEELIKGKNISEEQRDNIEDICASLYDNLVNDENPRISYYEETTQSLDKVLNIFVRINSGGTPLGYTDFLMSIIVNQWGAGRERINNAIDSIAKDYKFNIPKDIFLRGCLFLTDQDLQFKADNFKQDAIQKITDQFDNIVLKIQRSCKVFNSLGYTTDNLRSNLIILPLAYYLMQTDKTKLDGDNLKSVKRWIQLSILNRVFGASTTGYLSKLRKEVRWVDNFPLEEIIQVSKLYNKNMEITEEHLDGIIESAKKGSQDSWSLLTLLYPSKNYNEINFHEDHIYPYSKLTTEQKKSGGDFIANIQLLEGKENQSKKDTDPDKWIEKYCVNNVLDIKEYKKSNFIPDIDLTVDNFDEFIKQRKDLIKKEILKAIKY